MGINQIAKKIWKILICRYCPLAEVTKYRDLGTEVGGKNIVTFLVVLKELSEVKASL
jgi:hypothetical protein